nr:cannabinoid receptor type 1A [Ciona intestinalis]|eukprot:XP_002123433.1 cannabinoid receptor type 1A [Ciona intestinalis]
MFLSVLVRFVCIWLLVLTFSPNKVVPNKTYTVGEQRINFNENPILSEKFECTYVPELKPGNPSHIEDCCKYTYANFSRYWASGGLYISRLLESLKGWNCTQFKDECRDRTFSYNRFTKLMYDRFCNHSELVNECNEVIGNVFANRSREMGSWKVLTNELAVTDIPIEQASKPCVQVAFYERDAGGYGHFHEVIQPFLPFCPFIWCGFDERFVLNGKASVWNCMPHSCRVNIAIVMAVSIALAIIVILVNGIVLAVLCTQSKMRTSQGIYKLSLALADILVGVIVFPTFVSSLYKYQIVEHNIGELANVTGYVIKERATEPGQIATMSMRSTTGHFRAQFSKSYLNFVGFFTILSLTVSILTLVAAGIDRFIAVFRPTKYKQNIATPIAVKVTVALWALSFLFSVLPLFVPALSYTLVASILVSSAGPQVLVLYAFAFIVPLLLMWLVTILTFTATRSYKNSWKRLSTSDDRKAHGINEARLARTLGVMVGVFTLSILPSIVVLICGMFMSNIYPNLPKLLSPTATTGFTSAEVVVIFILMCNSIWNCFIYSIREQEFRRAAAQKFFCRKKSGQPNLDETDLRGLDGPIASEVFQQNEEYLDRTVFTEINLNQDKNCDDSVTTAV